MKLSTKTLLLAALMGLIDITAFAYDIAVENEDGVTIYYNYIADGTELEVCYDPLYSGEIKIPEYVNVNQRKMRVTAIEQRGFYGLKKITSISIPCSVKIIQSNTFYGCTNLSSLIIEEGDDVLYIQGLSSFAQCPLSTVYLGRNISYSSDFSSSPFSSRSIKELTIGDKVTKIGNYAFSDCTSLTSVEISSSVTSIGNSAFQNCTGLTSIEIPRSVTSIGNDAFSGCTGLTSVILEDGETTLSFSSSSYDDVAFYNCTTLHTLYLGRNISNSSSYSPFYRSTVKELTIGDKVTKIGNYAFSGCTGLTSVDIPSCVTSIGNSAFSGCTGLTSVDIPSCVTSIGNDAFSGCSGLTSVILEDGETTLSFSAYSYYDIAFYDCPALQTLYLGRNISYSSSYSPFYRSSIKELTIGDKVTSIGDYAFSDCRCLTSVDLPDNIINIGKDAFSCKLYSKRGTKTLLMLWNRAYKNNIYDKTTGEELLPPTMSVSITQTTAKVLLNGCKLDDGYTYSLNDEVLSDTIVAYQVLKPATQQYLTLTIKKDDIIHTVNDKYTTKSLEPRIEDFEVTASSISATGAYTEEDAKVVGHIIKINGYYANENYDAVDGNEIFLSGLNPGWGYNVEYTIEVDYGGEETATYTGSKWIYTESMKFQTAQPKVVSVGNVIVSTTVNLDENEENVGFEWRCTDWTDEFPSNTGTAYLYDGTIEGYIRNLNTDKLWKFRPYYLSNNGIYHYGNWMGVDPTNTSYFEPTVRTYAKINIDGNTALVKGYVLGGTDDIVVKGFKYWKTRTRANVETRAASIPSDAITVEATGQQTMSANLSGLEYNSTYHYIAFATTSAGDTYYGEEQMFTTPLATSKYSTFYDSETAYILPSGLTASVVTGVKDGKLTYKVIAEGGKSNNILPKGIAVMLTSVKGQPSSYTLTPTESSTSYNGENLLKGSDIDTKTFADGGNCWFYKLSYGASGSDYRDVFGWYWGAANGGAFQIEGHKAWLAIPKTTKVGTRAFSVDGDATDIYSIDNEQLTNDNSAIYDLQGREVDMPQSNGIYIVNGKKVYVK